VVDWRSKRVLAGAAAGVALAAGGGVAYATTGGSGDQPAGARDGFLEDVAGRLGVDAARLRDAFRAEAEERRGDGMPGPRGPHGARGNLLEDAAAYLGVEPDALREELESGKSLADVAKDEGKTVDGLVDALLAPVRESIEQLVEASGLPGPPPFERMGPPGSPFERMGPPGSPPFEHHDA
jgi:hypothetical protein